MKRIRILSLLVILALLLGVSGVVSAQEPEFFTSFTYTPSSPVYVGGTVTYTLAGFYGGGGGAGNDCLEIMIPTAWATSGIVPMVTASSSGLVPLGAMVTPSPCGVPNPLPVNAGGTTVFGVVVGPGATPFFDQATIALSQAFGVGDVGTGWIVRAGSTFGGFGAPSFIDATPLTVLAAATTRYVANNSAQCQGYTPCDTGTSGLNTALTDANATTIIVLGVYNAAPGTAHTLALGDTLKGQGGSSININGACQSASPFLTVTGASTIEDLTFDGTCSSGNPTAGINVTAAGATIQNVIIQNFANAGVLVNGAGGLTNDSVIYNNNGTGIQIDAGNTTITDDTFTGNTTGVDHNGGTVSVGTGPGTGNTFTGNTTGIDSVGANATIKDNTISGGINGISLSNAASAIWGNTVTGASNQQINCGGAFNGAGFNYIGGNITGAGSNCSDNTDQLGSPIESWTDTGTLVLNECTVTGDGPIFNLGNNAPFGFTPPLGRDSKYYAVTSSATGVTISVGTRSFRMLMAGTGCNPMTSTCWESDANGRSQVGAGYFFGGSQDPTAITLSNVTAQSPNTWLPLALVVAALVGVGGALVMLRRRRYS